MLMQRDGGYTMKTKVDNNISVYSDLAYEQGKLNAVMQAIIDLMKKQKALEVKIEKLKKKLK